MKLKHLLQGTEVYVFLQKKTPFASLEIIPMLLWPIIVRLLGKKLAI